MAGHPLSLLEWSLGVQLGVDTLVAVFFLFLARTIRLEEGKLWSWAWLAEAGAIACAVGLTLTIGPGPREGFLAPLPGRAFLAGFLFSKTLFAMLLARGVRFHTDPGFLPRIGTSGLLAVAAAWGAVASLVAHDPRPLLPVQWMLVATLLGASGLRAMRRGRFRSPILLGILLAEGALFSCYVIFMLPLMWGGSLVVPILFTHSSLVDAGADLLLALAAVLALERARAAQLEKLNQGLMESHEQLRQLADRDPLTGLANRRALRETLDVVSGSDAALIFLDIDDFKHVNDRFGHAAGDACLVRVAAELLRTFRPGDHIFRWGGDEFLVVAPGLEIEAAESRMKTVRAALAKWRSGQVPCGLSVGIDRLEPGGRPDEALSRADAAMYADKHKRSTAV